MSSSLPRDSGTYVSPAQKWRGARTQFYVRYLHILLYVGYLAHAGGPVQGLLSLEHLLIFLAGYFLFTTALFSSTIRNGMTHGRLLMGMWSDLLMFFAAFSHDPYSSAPSAITVIAILFGNGLRHGMRYYRDGTLGFIALGGLTIWLRQEFTPVGFPAEAMFTVGFVLISVLYGHMLMTRLWEGQQLLEQQNRFDDITGLLSRRALREESELRLDAARRSAQRCVLIYLDLDNFKQVNDQHGHTEGDSALLGVADILRRCTPYKAASGRYGGDEFVITMADFDRQKAEQLCRHIQTQVDQLADHWPGSNLSVSAGIASSPDDGMDFEELIRQADEDMYRSKRESSQQNLENSEKPAHRNKLSFKNWPKRRISG